MEKEVTIYDIAKILRLSPATISRALNDHPAINSKTKASIVAKSAELGYRSNTFATNLRKRTTETLGVIVPRLNSFFMSSVLAGMEQAASKDGYNLLISQSLESEKKEKVNATTMYNSRVDGLLVSVAYDSDNYDHFETFIKKGIPLLFFDRVIEHPKCTGVVIDNQLAGYQATSHLIQQGCQRIMHVTGSLKRNVYIDRFAGYRRALNEYNLPFDDTLLRETDLSHEAGIAAAMSWERFTDRPTGAFIANDVCAVSFMKTVQEKGYDIPSDIAVVGFNNDQLSLVIEPKLTTVHYPGLQMGTVAIKTMIGHLNGTTKMDPSTKIVLDTELIVRKSSLKNQK